MSDSVVLNNPLVLACFLTALALCCVGVFSRRAVCRFLGAGMFVTAVTVALLYGANLYEIGTVAMVFLTVNLLAPCKRGG